MSQAFKTFGTIRENLYQSDYINRKKRRVNCCNVSPCCKKNKLYCKNNLNTFNESNLIYGQYSALDLQNVCTVSNGPPPTEPESKPCLNQDVIINPADSNPFYLSHTIDPLGELFGRTQCGELNYTHYMVFKTQNN
jgi:hypothetical protein